MASFTKRGSTWQYTISNYIDGKNHPIRKGGFNTKREAQIAAAEVEAQKVNGKIKLINKEPFAKYFEKWIKTYKGNIHPNTKLRYQNSLKWVKDYFKNKPLVEITSFDYQEFLNWFGKNRSKASVDKIDSHVGACIRHAHNVGDIKYNITFNRKINATNLGKKAHDKYLNFDDSQKLYDYLLNHLEGSQFNYLFLIALVSGARFQELVGLTWKDLDFKHNTIDINKAWDHQKQTGFTRTKNEQSVRKITIDPTVMQEFKLICPDTQLESRIFKSMYNPAKSLTNNGANSALEKILRELGIKIITIHGLRHTHASVLLFNGASTQYIAERLGHKDVQTTLNTYSHVIKELKTRDDSVAIGIYHV